MSLQLYSLKKNFAVQKAERFFKERRAQMQAVDLKKHKLGLRELQLFARAAGGARIRKKSSWAICLKSPRSFARPLCATVSAWSSARIPPAGSGCWTGRSNSG